jgi:hypothetical protein
MTTPSTQWRVHPLAWVPISAAIIAETVSNGLRAYGLGTHLEKFTVSVWDVSVSLAGAVLVLAAVAVSLSQARAAWLALMPGPWRQRIVAGVAGLLLLAVSVTAMATHILEAERAKIGAEGGQFGSYERSLADYEAKKKELDTLSAVRPIDALKGAMEAAPVPRNVFRRTKECTDVTRDDSFTACKPILDLRQEMGLAIRKRQLEPEVSALKLALDGQAKPEVASTAEVAVAWWWGWLMGVAVVSIATFGAVIWAKPTTDTTAKSLKCKTVTDGSDVTEPAIVRQGTVTGDPELAEISDTELQRLRQWYFLRDQAEVDKPEPPRPKRKASKRQKRREKVQNWVREYTMEHGHPPAFRVVKGRFHLPAATASRWRQAALN